MVLERLFTLNVKHEFTESAILGFFYAHIAVITALVLLSKQASMLLVVFLSFLCIPYIYALLKREEKALILTGSERTVLRHHAHLFMVFGALFLGIGVALVLWASFSPPVLHETLFNVQLTTIKEINAITGNAVNPDFVQIILANNIKVFLVSVGLSFLFGYGALFVLAWNAAMISNAIGAHVRAAFSWTLPGILNSASSASAFLLHGIPEFGAYIIGGVIGSMVSIAVINREFHADAIKKIITDTAYLFVIALLILTVSAWVEVYISPSFL